MKSNSLARPCEGVSKNIRIARDLEFLADANGLEVGAEDGRYADFLRSVMRVAVNLVDDRLDVEHVVALDILEVGGPAVVGCEIGKAARGRSPETA